MITFVDWLSCQNGTVPAAVVHPDPMPRFPRLGRDLGVYVRTDTPYEASFNAAQMLAAELLPYEGSDAAQLTLGSEANKLASNIGIARNFAGVHYRSDYQQGLILGEALAISVLRDEAATYAENYQGFTFTRFDGRPEKI